jgi:hypothetical protein
MLVKKLDDIFYKERGKEFKVPYYTNAAATRDSNLPHMTANRLM